MANEYTASGHHRGEDPSMPIAIVGMSCRFPGDATDLRKLWQMCAAARDAWSPVPKERFNQDAFYHPDANRNGTSNVRGAHFLAEDLSLFDAPFFNMTPAEAAALDPQQRLLLECCYEALENSGIPVKKVSGSDTAVFVGSFCRDWSEIMMRDPDSIPMYQATGGGQSLLSNRLSYFFNLRGPSVTVDTACSASLVALHLACQSLRSGEARQAIVGGANVILSHELMISMSMMRFLSPDGRSYTYDHRANGYARGEGAACIVLKPLADALRDGDSIRAVIRNSGINQDGKTSGITLPSGEAQSSLIASVYKSAGLNPLETTYVEAHGTGTPAGDPIEASALSKVFSPGRPQDRPLHVGSIKTNIGHLEGASGLAGVIKAVLMLENKMILPNTNFEIPNSRIPLDDWRLNVPTRLLPWEHNGILRASINSFGYGGTNAHIIIDEAIGYLSRRESNGSSNGTHVPVESSMPNGINGIYINGDFIGTSTRAEVNGTHENGVVNGVHESGVTNEINENGVVSGIHENGVANEIHENGVVNGIHENGVANGTHENGVVNEIHENGVVNGIHENGVVNEIHENGVANKNGVINRTHENGVANESEFSEKVNGTQTHAEINERSANEGVDCNHINETTETSRRLFCLSAFDEACGKRQIKNLCDYLKDRPDSKSEGFLDDLAYTLGERRSVLPWKTAISACSTQELVKSLESSETKFVHGAKAPILAYCFTGQGAQWYGMGREMIQSYPVFRHSIMQSSRCLHSLGAQWNLVDELLRDEKSSRVNSAALSQPMCTAIQIALVDLLGSLNIKPAAVTGHSSGEIAAAYAAGALTQESAIAVSYHRGLAVASIKKAHYSTKGAMLAVGLSQAEAETILLELKCGKAVIACYNSPTSLTISGDEEAISELHSLLQERNKFSRKLVVDVAYHSHHMKLVADQYLAAIQKIETQSSTSVEVYSSVTGNRTETSALDPKYWVDNMLNPVRFSEALRDLCLGVKSSRKRSKRTSAAAVDIIIEIGPHSALAGPIKQIIKSDSRLSSSSLAYLPTLIRQRDAVETLQALAGRLYERGWTIDMSAVNSADDLRRRRLLVDLPPYPWNHTTSYWAESRESQRYRLRPHPRSDLLGVQVRQSSSVEPQWRNLIRPAEIPWIRDHKVENNIVYPAAGFLVMAIEAAFQRAITPEANIRGYDLREIAIGSALVIPETSDEVEVFFSLRPYNESSRSSSSTWEEFRIFSSSDDGNSVEHCRGLISVRKGSPGKGVDIHRSWQQQHVLQRQQWEAVCTNAVDVNEMYDSLRRIGLEYGPTFARVTSACHGLNKAVGIVSIPDTASIMPSHFEYPFILHPSTLDSCFHTFFPAMMSQQGNLKQPVLPTFISNMSVSHNIVRTPGHELAVCAESVGMGYRRTTSSLTVFDTASVDPSPVIVIDGMVTTSITKTEGTDTNQSQRRLCFYTRWDSDPDLLSAEQVIDLCTHIKPPLEESEHVKTLEQAAYYYVERALMQTSVDDVPKMQPHHQKLYAAIKEFRESVHNQTLDYDTTSWPSATEDQRDLILERVKTSGDEGRLLAHVGENLGAIFKQEVEPLSVMMADNRLENYYRNNARMARQYEQAATYISLLAHKNPHLKILEIGAGTGGASFVILKALGGTDGTLPRFASYDYTDISTGFFEKSKEKAAPWGDLVAFRKFDIETDPSQQGFELGSYDLVIAANVLHATKYMERTMTHVRQLLKAGGSLVLTELTRKKASMAVLFGEEETRRASPLLTEDEWNDVLRKTGFTGVDVAIWDTPDEVAHHGSNMIARASVDIKDAYPTNVTVVAEGGASSRVRAVLSEEMSKYVQTTNTATLSSLDPKGSVCIVLNELDSSVLRDPSRNNYESVRRIFSETDGVIWVTRGATQSTHPDASLVTGLTRTVTSEAGSVVIVTLDLDGSIPIEESKVARLILDVFRKNFMVDARVGLEFDAEYIERGGKLMIPRVMEDTKLSDFAASRSGVRMPEDQPFYQPGRALRLEIGTPGLLDTLHFVDDTRALERLPEDHVEIEVKASGVNFRDVMMSMGQIDVQRLGGECCGVVSAVGSAVSRLRVGDRVVAFVDGSFANYVRWPASGVEKIPDDMPFEVGATLPIVYCTAYHSIKVASLSQGETVLIHAASGGLGQALIMLCQNIGAEIFATVGTPEKNEFLRKQYGIPEDHIFSSRDETFASGIMRMTNDKGVDVIFNSVSGDMLRRTFECIASFGRFIELGKKDFAVNTRLEMRSFARNVTFAAVDLVTLLAEKPKYGSDMWAQVMSLVRTGVVKPPQPITVFSMGEVEKALRTMQIGRHIGKLVIVPQPSEIVKVMPQQASRTLLRTDASYLLVGGLGGLGRAIALWMVHHGARAIIFASPSGAAKQEAKDTIRAIEEQGALVSVFNCDVSDVKHLDTVINQASQSMPPIRGIIQMAMVMRNSMFKNMSIEDWNDSLKPKVQGTWNLHNAFRSADLDFFLMLSSTVGILGNASQAAYGAASTFLDAFAQYRHRLGLPAMTIDIGMVLGVGYVAENEKVRQSLERQGFDGIHQDELMALMESAFANYDRGDATGSVITGLGTWTEREARPVFSSPRFSHFRRMALGVKQSEESASDSTNTVRNALRQATSLDDATTVVCDAIISKMSALLMVPLEEINSGKPMQEYGMDSLVAVEMRNWISSNLGATIPILEMLGNISLRNLSAGIVGKSTMVDLAALEKTEH